MFYIGKHLIDPLYVSAPMASITDVPFRLLVTSLGAGLATTDLISSSGFLLNKKNKKVFFDKKLEKIVSAQIFGNDSYIMSKASMEMVLLGADIIDINMGCPSKKIVKTGAGSYLLKDVKKTSLLMRAIIDFLSPTPVTAKIRSGIDLENVNCLDIAKSLEDVGCSALAIHPRTAAQGYSGKANWKLIYAIKKSISIPVIGNGDIRSLSDAAKMRSETGCDGVMIGRAAIGSPWIFNESENGKVLDLSEKLFFILAHLRYHAIFHNKFKEDNPLYAIKLFRTHLACYSRGINNSSSFRKKIMTLNLLSEIEYLIYKFFSF